MSCADTGDGDMRQGINRKDANHTEVVQCLIGIGARWRDATGMPSFGCDGIILFRKRAFLCEIKDGAKPPSARTLTENERELKELCESVGAPYLVVTSGQDAIEQLLKIS